MKYYTCGSGWKWLTWIWRRLSVCLPMSPLLTGITFHLLVMEDVIARKPSASPATGYNKVHVKEQKDLVARAFGIAQAEVDDENIKATVEVANKKASG